MKRYCKTRRRLGALILTTLLATFLGVKLFRWEKEEKIARRREALAGGRAGALPDPRRVSGPDSKESIVQAQAVDAAICSAAATLLIRGARIFVGDGRVIESGAVLIKRRQDCARL